MGFSERERADLSVMTSGAEKERGENCFLPIKGPSEVKSSFSLVAAIWGGLELDAYNQGLVDNFLFL